MAETEEPTQVEFLKAVSDHFKHVTTLCSGFILVMAAFLEQLFRKPEWKSLVVVSLGAFILAILFSALAQAYYISYLQNPRQYLKDKRAGMTVGVTLAAWGSFLIGVLSLIAFTVKNFL